MNRPPADIPQSGYSRELPPYPFARLDTLRQEVESRGIRVIDLGPGDPQEVIPPVFRDALINAVPKRSSYPRAIGMQSLREAVAGWLNRRFGVDLDPETEILPTNGAKEAIFGLPAVALDRAERPLALVPNPGYPVYALGVRAFGGDVHEMSLHAGNGFLPELTSLSPSVWSRASMLWVNYPNNPTGVVAGREFYADAAGRCREHGVLLASDEAYADTYYDDPPPSALQAGTENILVFHSLSKRSGLPGMRSGFVAGDRRIIDALKRIRPAMGVATPQFIQEAAAVAWNDDQHAAEIRERFRLKRDLLTSGLEALGFSVAPSPAGLFAWVSVPPGHTSESFATLCLEAGVGILPGPALGLAGEGFVRIAFTAEPEDLQEALARMRHLSVEFPHGSKRLVKHSRPHSRSLGKSGETKPA